MKVEIRQVSSLEKVFLDKNQEFEEIKKGLNEFLYSNEGKAET